MEQKQVENIQELPLKKRLLRLAVALGCLWIVVFVLAPLAIEHFPPMRHYSQQADKYDLHPGALYYNDVPTTSAGEANSRQAVRVYEGSRGN